MSAVSLTEDVLFRLHPTAIGVNPALTITSYGPVAGAYAPSMRTGRRLAEFFECPSQSGFADLTHLAAAGKGLVLVSRERGIRLGASVFPVDAGYLIVPRPMIADITNITEGLKITDVANDDPMVQCLLQIALLQGLRDEAERTARDLKSAWEEKREVVDQLRRITGFIAHEFSNLLSIIQLNCERALCSAMVGGDTARAIGLIRESAVRGGSVSQWLRALSGDADLSHREPLDEFLGANLPLLETLCGPEARVTARLLGAAGASLDAPMCGLLNCLVNLVRMAAASAENGIRADIATMFSEAPGGAQSMAQVRILLEADRAIDGAALLARRRQSFTGPQTARVSVREFAKSVGGTAQCEPAGGNAITISLHIPCIRATEPNRATGPATSRSAATTGGRHLIVVEDEPAALEALVELLEFEGFSVTPCANGEQALAALVGQAEPILITDVVLPTIDGLALAKAATLVNPQIRVVIMSGHIPDHEHLDQRWAVLQKPFNVDELIAAIIRIGR
jgi:CheY-like chemotaxis protein/signal transduction histidine kinase